MIFEIFSRFNKNIGLYPIPGWLNKKDAALLHKCMLRSPNLHAIELGTFCGKSACVLAHAIRKRGHGKLICCDYFPKNYYYNNQIIKDTHHQFLSNIKKYKFEDIIEVLPGDHLQSFKMINGKFGLIYIDGGHHEEHILRCIDFSLKHLVSGGFILFDDYGFDEFPDVKKCVDHAEQLYGFKNPKLGLGIKAFTVA